MWLYEHTHSFHPPTLGPYDRHFPLGIRWSEALQGRGGVAELLTVVRGELDKSVIY